jgi:hypothetical protein
MRPIRAAKAHAGALPRPGYSGIPQEHIAHQRHPEAAQMLEAHSCSIDASSMYPQ